jgi:hypothetical protein
MRFDGGEGRRRETDARDGCEGISRDGCEEVFGGTDARKCLEGRGRYG